MFHHQALPQYRAVLAAASHLLAVVQRVVPAVPVLAYPQVRAVAKALPHRLSRVLVAVLKVAHPVLLNQVVVPVRSLHRVVVQNRAVLARQDQAVQPVSQAPVQVLALHQVHHPLRARVVRRSLDLTVKAHRAHHRARCPVRVVVFHRLQAHQAFPVRQVNLPALHQVLVSLAVAPVLNLYLHLAPLQYQAAHRVLNQALVAAQNRHLQAAHYQVAVPVQSLVQVVVPNLQVHLAVPVHLAPHLPKAPAVRRFQALGV